MMVLLWNEWIKALRFRIFLIILYMMGIFVFVCLIDVCLLIWDPSLWRFDFQELIMCIVWLVSCANLLSCHQIDEKKVLLWQCSPFQNLGLFWSSLCNFLCIISYWARPLVFFTSTYWGLGLAWFLKISSVYNHTRRSSARYRHLMWDEDWITQASWLLSISVAPHHLCQMTLHHCCLCYQIGRSGIVSNKA